MLQYSAPITYGKSKQFANGGSFAAPDRDALIAAHLGKVRYIADRMAAKLPPSIELDDLYGAGVIGLIDAVERFDASRGIAFTTFAEMRVRGAMLDNLRSLDWASRTTRKRAKEVQKVYQTIEQRTGAPATEEAVAEQLKISVADLRETLQDLRGLTVANLNEREDETGLSLMDNLRDHGASPLEQLEDAESRKLLAQAIDKLPERERQVVALYYVEELTMKEIGEVLNVSESRVSQMRTQAMIRLRANFGK